MYFEVYLQVCEQDPKSKIYSCVHLVGDVKDSQDGMKETFLLTNIVPQDYDNNGGFWYRMENYCRSLTNKFSDVYVMSGPLFLSHLTTEQKKVVNFQVKHIFYEM